jgi:hypothetical protein
MWASEKKLPARGVKFYFIIKQDIPEKERAFWQEAVLRSSPLSQWFTRVQFEYSDHPTLISDWQGWNLIKIFCPDAHIPIKPSEAKSFYKEVFIQFSQWFVKLCRDRKIECKPYDFRILFRLHPPESSGEFVPIPPLNDISRKIVSPPNVLPNPPSTPEAMLDLAQQNNQVSGKEFEVLLKSVEEKKMKLYGAYGIRTEEHASTYEFDIVPREPSEEAESMRSLQGELLHELILQSQRTAPPDFNEIVNTLLARLLEDGVIDAEKVQHIVSNPGDYSQTRQGCVRFVLKFDLKKWSPGSELGRALDVAKKRLQKEFAGRGYNLYGAISYKLTDEDLTRIEAVMGNIVYFRNARRDELFANVYMLFLDNNYERIIEIARKTDEILNSHKIIDFSKSPDAATDIEDAKRRWDSAASDLVRDGGKVTSFYFLREISGVPLQVFIDARESLCKELKEIAAHVGIRVTITSDIDPYNRYGCYVAEIKPEHSDFTDILFSN